jgi:HEAT repeat protein
VLIGPPTVASVREVLLRNPDPTARALAASVLMEASRQANRPWAQDALAALIMALKDNDPNVRAAANMGIDRFRFQSLEQLYVGLRENNPQFRVEIINILADILHPLSIQHLEELLKTEKDPEVRKLAEAAIHRIKEADTLTPK